MENRNKKYLKITFTLKNCGIEKVQMIEINEDATEEQNKKYMLEMKEKIKQVMYCDTILSSIGDDFFLIAGGSIACAKCEYVNISNVEKE